MPANAPTEIAAYCRVSSESQADRGLGLAIQQDQIKDWLARNPQYRMHKLYVDPGFSGSLPSRPGLDELMRDASAGLFKKAVVVRYDRLSRDLLLLLQLERALAVAGVEVISIAETFGVSTDPTAIMVKQVFGAVAQLDKARVVQRLRDGRIRKLRAGRHPASPPPWGYRISPRKELELDPPAAATVKKIFRWRYGRKSFQWIADQLNASGERPPKKGKKFYASTIRYVVRNSAVYRGFARYGELVKGIHPPISLR